MCSCTEKLPRPRHWRGGFIGSALVHALNQRGITQIIVTDCLGEDEKWRNLLPLTFEDYVPADEFLSGIEEDADHFGRFSAVFHSGRVLIDHRHRFRFCSENNYAYTKALCRWALFWSAFRLCLLGGHLWRWLGRNGMTKPKTSRASVR
jgi:hypothetical protein